jgi:LmbE family N-acetylglucosaminyl deacetylase
MEMRIEPPGAGPILAIAAHPDDVESWCAGTLALATDRGASVRLLLVTSGDKGSSDPRATSSAVASRREREARDAARHLGITEVAFLRYLDGEVEDTRTLRGTSWQRSGAGAPPCYSRTTPCIPTRPTSRTVTTVWWAGPCWMPPIRWLAIA